MATSLKIAGTERINDLEKNTLDIQQVLTYQIDTCQFNVTGTAPAEGEEVIIEDDDLGRLFGGIIKIVELSRTSPDKSKSLKVWQIDSNDYTALLDRRLVVETYENMTADAIFLDIVTKYCPGFTTTGVQAGAPTIEKIIFDYTPVSEAFKQLCEYVGWHWQPDYFKDLQFFSTDALSNPAPMELIPGGSFRGLKHTIDTQGLRNRIYVRGGTMLSDPFTYEIKADGAARAWVLPHKPHEISMTVNAVPVTVGIENNHEEADFEYLMNYQEKYVRASEQTPTIATGTTIRWVYRYDIDVITTVEDLASQQALAAVQGGDGVYEHVIVDKSLTTIEAAEAAGNADLREHANPRVKGSFTTEVTGWSPGQLLPIDLPDRGIIGQFLVQKVTISRPSSSPAIWSHRVRYGGRLLGIANVLKALVSAQQKKTLNDTSILHKFVYGSDGVSVTDELIITSRVLPYVCGDLDAVCGLVVVSD
ncbi:MAG: hypothetical protein ACOY46_19860 [Bacillota bacterium]